MANDARSSLSAMGQTAAIAPDTGALRRSAGLGNPDTGGPAYITAEIPAVPVGPSYGVLLPDGSVWYPGSRKRLPAPLLLRIVVWILAFATLLAGAGDFVVRYHPSWLSTIRRTVPAQSSTTGPGATKPKGTPAGKGTKASSTTVPASNAAVKELSPQPTLPRDTTAYSVVARSYSVVVTAGPHPVWVFAQSVVNGVPVSTGRVFEDETVPAGHSYVITPTSGVVTVEVAAGGAKVAVFHGSKRLGSVVTNPHAPWYYWFERVRSH